MSATMVQFILLTLEIDEFSHFNIILVSLFDVSYMYMYVCTLTRWDRRGQRFLPKKKEKPKKGK